MRYYSTRENGKFLSFAEAVMGGMNASGGLFMPERIPAFSPGDLETLSGLGFPELASRVIAPFAEGSMAPDEVLRLCRDAFDFPIPIVDLGGGLSVLELFHGPTCAFKDVGARFMARAMAHFKEPDESVRILVATSGDTGSAVGSAFHGLSGFSVTILFPKGRISPLQEKQLSTFDGNVRALAVDGSFDDCQRLVKEAFTDGVLRERVRLSSANSINIARLVPQASYYAWAALRVAGKDPSGAAGSGRPLSVMVVPSGNFGNLTAGLFALRMGFPIDGFLAATNVNRTVPDYLESGEYRPRDSVATISNAMDVGAPSNFERMRELFSLEEMRAVIRGRFVTDPDTRAAIRACREEKGYVMEPHGAVGYQAWKREEAHYADIAGSAGFRAVILETAHPAKFSDVVREEIGIDPEIPERLAAVLHKPDRSLPLRAEYGELRDYLLSGAV
jgi:threonine synthase